MAKILVIIDPDADEQTALMRCSEMAPGANLDIHIARFIERPIQRVPDKKFGSALIAAEKERLDQLVKQQLNGVQEVTTEVIPFSRLYEAIIQTATRINADFVFKPLRKHNPVARTLFTSTDWNLVRLCPLPLLLTNPGSKIVGKPVIAAIDVCNQDTGHEELNRMVLSQAKTVARVIHSDVYAVNAFTPPTAMWGYGAADPIPYEITRDQHKDHVAEAYRLAEEFGISNDHVSVCEGVAEQVVNEVAGQLSASLIVLGTVARSGLAGLFIGNTAEAVLERSQTDVLVVKPAGFKSPIEAAA